MGIANPGNGFELVTTVVVVEIFTTEGISFSAKSANEFGTSFANTCEAKAIEKTMSINFLIFFILIFNIPNNNKANNCKN